MRRELKIGIFLAGTFFILGLFIFIVGDLSLWFRKTGYDLTAHFGSVTGLEKQDAVRMSGVKIGYVKDIRLARRHAEVLMAISPQYQVPKGSKASVASLGLIGEKYIEITPSEQADNYPPGGVLESTQAVGFDEMGAMAMSIGEDVKALSQSLNKLIGEENRTEIGATLEHLDKFTDDLQDFMRTNKQALSASIEGVSRASRDLDQRVDELSKSLDQTIAAVKGIAEENRAPVKSDIEKIGVVLDEIKDSLRLLQRSLEKIDKGEGTVGKLIQDPELYDKAKTTLASVENVVAPLKSVKPIGLFRFDYLGENRMVRSSATLGLELSLDISSSARRSRTRSSRSSRTRPRRECVGISWPPGPASSNRRSAPASTWSASATDSSLAWKDSISSALSEPTCASRPRSPSSGTSTFWPAWTISGERPRGSFISASAWASIERQSQDGFYLPDLRNALAEMARSMSGLRRVEQHGRGAGGDILPDRDLVCDRRGPALSGHPRV